MTAPEVIVFPDAVQAVLDYLTPALLARGESAPVVEFVPDPRPDRVVQVRHAGGSMPNLVTDRVRVAFDVWAPTSSAASDLIQLVRGLLLAWPASTLTAPNRVAQTASPASMPDATRIPRFTWAAEIDLRGTAIA